jgi:hypothetical protein
LDRPVLFVSDLVPDFGKLFFFDEVARGVEEAARRIADVLRQLLEVQLQLFLSFKFALLSGETVTVACAATTQRTSLRVSVPIRYRVFLSWAWMGGTRVEVEGIGAWSGFIEIKSYVVLDVELREVFYERTHNGPTPPCPPPTRWVEVGSRLISTTSTIVDSNTTGLIPYVSATNPGESDAELESHWSPPAYITSSGLPFDVFTGTPGDPGHQIQWNPGR